MLEWSTNLRQKPRSSLYNLLYRGSSQYACFRDYLSWDKASRCQLDDFSNRHLSQEQHLIHEGLTQVNGLVNQRVCQADMDKFNKVNKLSAHAWSSCLSMYENVKSVGHGVALDDVSLINMHVLIPTQYVQLTLSAF